MQEETAKQTLQGLIAVCITFFVLNTFFVVLRFISRFHVKQQQLGWDDALTVAGYITNIGLCIDSLGVLIMLNAAGSRE